MSKLKQAIHRLCRERHLRSSLARLRQLETQLVAPETRVAVPFLFKGSGYFRRIRPKQSQQEIGALFRAVLDRRPRVVVEIGTCHGGTLYLWCQAADPAATIISIDLPEGEFGGGYEPARAELYRAFAKPGQRLHLLRSDSHAPATFDHVRELVGDRQIDLLFIDGDHTYSGVKQDFEMYSRLVSADGLIAFHDILKRDDLPRIEVWKLWAELKDGPWTARELVDELPDGRPIGIGVLERVR